MTADDKLRTIVARAERATGLGELEELLREVQQQAASEDLTPAQHAHVARRLLTSASDLTLDRPDAARPLIMEFLVPMCLLAVKAGETDHIIETGKLRNLLGEWLEGYVDSSEPSIRAAVLNELNERLHKTPTKECLWAIAAIGYREDSILASVQSLAFRDDEVGDAALNTLVRLGNPPETRKTVVERLKQKITTGGIRKSFLFCIQETAVADTVALIAPHLRQPDTDSTGRSSENMVLIGALTKAASADPENIDLQKAVWGTIRNYPADVTCSGDFAANCNVEDTVVDYVDWIVNGVDEGDPFTRRYIYYDRMAEFIRPRALAGWKLVNAGELLPLLRADATHDTKLTGRYVTSNVRLKEAAFETGFRLGAAVALDWLDDAVSRETSGYVKEIVLELSACQSVDDLPKSVVNLIIEERNIGPRDGTDEFVARTGAIKLAQSAGTRQAFEVLHEFGFTYDGEVLRATAVACAEAARQRIEQGDVDIVQFLLGRAMRHSTPKRHRDVAVDSLCHLAACGLIQEQIAEEILHLVELDDVSRCRAIETLGFLPIESSKKVVSTLTDLASNESTIGWRAMEALVRQGLFESNAELLSRHIGLVRFDAFWTLKNSEKIVGWQAFLVGLLYQRDRDGFAAAVARVLEDADADAIFQILKSVEYHGAATPAVVTDSLVLRIYKRFTPGTAETELFESLAVISSDRLASEPWDREWHRWLPEARVALCNALGGSVLSEHVFGHSFALLSDIAFDGNVAVRRAAYRAMAALDIQAFMNTCASWATSKLTRLRKHAAEAVGWIPITLTREGSFNDWGLPYDPEKSVREIAAQGRSERFERHWSQQYLEVVLKVKESDNRALLEAYRYGHALTKMGDDATIRCLKRHLERTHLPPHVNHWIRSLIKRTTDRWRKISRSWPEPWFNWSGVVEELDGEIVLDSGKTFPAHFSLWRVSQTTPSNLGEWGGAVRPPSSASWVEFFGADTAIVRIPGRRESKIIVSSQFSTETTSRLLIVNGSDHYPAAAVT